MPWSFVLACPRRCYGRRLRGDGFGGNFSLAGLPAGGKTSRGLASDAGSVGGSPCSLKQRVAGSSLVSGELPNPQRPQSLGSNRATSCNERLAVIALLW